MALALPALGAPVAGGSPTTVFNNVPVAPRSFPDYSPNELGIRGNPKVMPQAFTYGNRADAKSMLAWYRGRLRQYGWHIEQERANYPAPGDRAIIGTRSGQALTIVIAATRYGSRVSVIKLNASK